MITPTRFAELRHQARTGGCSPSGQSELIREYETLAVHHEQFRLLIHEALGGTGLCAYRDCCDLVEAVKAVKDVATLANVSIAVTAPLTVAELNALPPRVRRYVHDVETRCDPAGDIATITSLTEQRDALVAKLQEIERSPLDTLDVPVTFGLSDEKRAVVASMLDLIANPPKTLPTGEPS